MRIPLVCWAVMALFCVIGPRASAQVTVDFHGGNGSPLSFTLPVVTFQVTDAAVLNGSELAVLVIAVNNSPGWSSGVVTPTNNSVLWSSTNAGITFMNNTGYNFYANAGNGSPFAGNVAWFGLPFSGTLSNGDQLTFAGGTLGGGSTPSATFTDGVYNLYLTDMSGNVGAIVAAVPEPATNAALAGLVVLVAVGVMRRRSRVAS